MLASVGCGLCVPAGAQEAILPPRADVAGARAQPDFDPLGIRLGSWKADAGVRVTQGFDSNLFVESDDRDAAGFMVLAPSLTLRSDWSRHEVSAAARGTFTRYYDYPRLATNEFAASVGSTLDFGRVSFRSRSSLGRTAERRGENGAPLSFGQPSLYTVQGQSLELRGEFAPFVMALTGGHADISYSGIRIADGTTLSQDFRNTRDLSAGVRVAVTPTDRSAIGFSGEYSHARNRQSARSSDSVKLAALAAIDTGMVRFEAEVGHLRKSFDNPVFRDFSGLTYSGTVEWYATPLLTVGVDARRRLENSGNAAVGVVETRSLAAHADYELLRNLLLRITVRERRQRYPEIAVQATSRTIDITSEYKFNRSVAIESYTRIERRESTDSTRIRPFHAVLGGISLIWRL